MGFSFLGGGVGWGICQSSLQGKHDAFCCQFGACGVLGISLQQGLSSMSMGSGYLQQMEDPLEENHSFFVIKAYNMFQRTLQNHL